MPLTAPIKHSIDTSILCWLATATPEGIPSVSPKEMFTHFDNDSIIIANIASPNSARNIKANPHACVSFIDIFTQRGFQVSGKAEYIQSTDASFSHIAEPLLKMAGPDFPFKAIFRVYADAAHEVIAPRYRLFPETTEAQQIKSAMRTYGVQPQP